MTEKNKSGKNKEREKYPKGYMNDGKKDLTGMSQKNILLRTEQNRTEQNRTEQNRTEQAQIELGFVALDKIKKDFFKKHSDLLMS